MTKSFSDQAECCKGVCKPSSTAMFDNEECSIEFEQLYTSQQEAEQALAFLTEKARKVESEPCEIHSQFETTSEGVVMKAKFTFSCQAETIIFQLSLR